MRENGRTVTTSDLVDFIVHHFSEADLRQLCLEMDISYDALRGSGTQEKGISLVTYCADRGQLERLLAAVAAQRPRLAETVAQMQAELLRKPVSRHAQPRPLGRIAAGGLILFALGAFALLAAAGWQRLRAGAEWQYQVLVQDGETGTPLPRSRVTLVASDNLAPQDSLTDVNGLAVFLLPVSLRGRYASLTVEKEAYQSVTQNITLDPERPPPEISLFPAP